MGKKRNTVNDRKYTGGMIASDGFNFQDCASIKYLFKYLDLGLEEISFESEDDFCIVTKSMRVNIQAKNEELTPSFARTVLKDIPGGADVNIIIGSGCNNAFHNIIRYSKRHANNLNGLYYEDKEELEADWESFCKTSKLDKDLLLHCEFDVIDFINRKSIAIAAIAEWAEKRKIIVRLESLFNDLKNIVEVKRCVCGHLSYKEIVEIINRHRDTRIIKSNYEQNNDANKIIEKIEKLITDIPLIADKLMLIKVSIENRLLAEAEANIAELISQSGKMSQLIEIRVWLLNNLQRYDEVIDAMENEEISSDFAILEASKAMAYVGKVEEAKDILDNSEKSLWDEEMYVVRALMHMSNEEDEEAKELLKECLRNYSNSISALFWLGEISEGGEAVDYFNRIKGVDKNCPLSYLGLAEISESAFDFELAYGYFIDYFSRLSVESDVPFYLYAKVVVLSWVCKKDDTAVWLRKLNRSFRKQMNVSGSEVIALPLVDRDVTHYFYFVTDKAGYSLYNKDVCLFKSLVKEHYYKPAIGLVCPGIDFNLFAAVNAYSDNPIRKDPIYSLEEAAVPSIILLFDKLENYECIRKRLLETGKLLINHEFEENQYDYLLKCTNDIEVSLMVINNELDGKVVIGGIELPIVIESTGQGLENFVKQLNRNCGFNEAAIELRLGETHLTRIVYEKDRIDFKDMRTK